MKLPENAKCTYAMRRIEFCLYLCARLLFVRCFFVVVVVVFSAIRQHGCSSHIRLNMCSVLYAIRLWMLKISKHTNSIWWLYICAQHKSHCPNILMRNDSACLFVISVVVVFYFVVVLSLLLIRKFVTIASNIHKIRIA